MRLPKDKTLSFKRCEIRSGHFCYCYIDYWSYGNRKCKAGSTGRQIIGLVAGVILMIILSMIDYVWLLNFTGFYTGSISLHWYVWKAVWNQCKWCTAVDRYQVTNFQPSELSKILVVVFFAKFLMSHEDDLNSAATILKAVGLIAPTLILIVLQPDLSTTLSIALVFLLPDVSGGS